MKKGLEFCFSFLWQEHLNSKISEAWLCVYVSITVIFWQKVHDALSANISPFQSVDSNTRVVCKRCSRLIQKTLARRKSIVVVHLSDLNKLRKERKCPVWYWQYFNADISHIHNAASRAIGKKLPAKILRKIWSSLF